MHILLKNTDYFDRHISLHDYNKKKKDLIIPFFHTKNATYGPNYLAMKFYNKLQSMDTRSQDLRIFKRRVYNYLIDGCFYPYQEFLDINNAP